MQSEKLARANQKAFARRRQCDATRRPNEELRRELALELSDVAAQGLLGDEEPCRRAREVELLRGRNEVPQRPQVELTSDRRMFVIHAPGRLILRVKVLDLGPPRCEAGRSQIEFKETEMLDGAALGTLMIGLDNVRQANDWTETSVRRSARRAQPTTSTFRVRLATALRFAADRLDRTTPAPREILGVAGVSGAEATTWFKRRS